MKILSYIRTLLCRLSSLMIENSIFLSIYPSNLLNRSTRIILTTTKEEEQGDCLLNSIPSWAVEISSPRLSFGLIRVNEIFISIDKEFLLTKKSCGGGNDRGLIMAIVWRG